MSVPYGYYIAPNGHVAIDQEKANIVRMIYRQYLSGMSLGGIADFLFKRKVYIAPFQTESAAAGLWFWMPPYGWLFIELRISILTVRTSWSKRYMTCSGLFYKSGSRSRRCISIPTTWVRAWRTVCRCTGMCFQVMSTKSGQKTLVLQRTPDLLAIQLICESTKCLPRSLLDA